MGGCGVDTHDEECLCDVVITKHVDVSVNDAVNNMWMGARICDIKDYGAPWSDGSMLDYFQDLLTLHDAWTVRREFVDVDALTFPEGMDIILRWKLIRDEVERLITELDAPLVQILSRLNVTIDDFLSAASTNKITVSITEESMNVLEQRLMNPKQNMDAIASDVGVSLNIVRSLSKYYRGRRQRVHGDSRPASSMLKVMSTSVNDDGVYTYTSSEIMLALKEKFGIEYSRSAISHTRKRMRYIASCNTDVVQ